MKRALLTLVVGCLLGAGVTHWLWSARNERDLASIILLRDVAEIGQATRHLELLEQERFALASKSQRMLLDSTIDSCYRNTQDYEPSFNFQAAPSMILEIERAQSYLARVSPDSRSRLWFDKIVDYLDYPYSEQASTTSQLVTD